MPEGSHTHGHTHIKYVFVDVRPLRRFAPPPLQGGGVYFGTPSIVRWVTDIRNRASLCSKNAAPPIRCGGFENQRNWGADFRILGDCKGLDA